MKHSKHLAIDMGAGSIRIVLGTFDGEKITLDEIYRFSNEIKTIENSDKWDIKHIFANITKGINKALEEHSDITSLGIDSWGVDYVLIDDKGNLLETPFAYRDSSTEGMREKWNEFMSDQVTFKLTGINYYPFNTLYQLLSRKNSESLKKAYKLLFIPNYIYYKLTGKIFNEITIASTSQLLDVSKNSFNKNILDLLGLEESLLTPLKEAGEIIGEVNNINIKPNKIKAVSVCSHDTASAVAAIPAIEKNFLFISTGTWCILGTESSTPLLSEPARALGFTNERSCENKYRVLKNIVGLWLVQGIKKSMNNNIDYSHLESMAQESPESNLLVNPEDEIFYNPENMIDAFDKFFEKTKQQKPASIGEYVRIAYKSLSVAFAYYLKKLEKLTGKEYKYVHVFGGGIKSEIFCQYISNYTGKIVISGPVEGSSLGNIMVQNIGLGNIGNITEGRKIIGNSIEIKKYIPQQESGTLEEITKKYLSLKTF